jgi:hypothetical protein
MTIMMKKYFLSFQLMKINIQLVLWIDILKNILFKLIFNLNKNIFSMFFSILID